MKVNAFVFLLFLMAFSGCEKDLPDSTFGDPLSARKLLIAGTASPFKQEVIRQIMNKIDTNGMEIRVTGLDGLPKINTSDFKAILLVTALKAGKIDKQAEEFIRSQVPNDRIILFYTRGSEEPSPGWSAPKLGVDTVTSASLMDRAVKRAEQLADLIQKKLGR